MFIINTIRNWRENNSRKARSCFHNCNPYIWKTAWHRVAYSKCQVNEWVSKTAWTSEQLSWTLEDRFDTGLWWWWMFDLEEANSMGTSRSVEISAFCAEGQVVQQDSCRHHGAGSSDRWGWRELCILHMEGNYPMLKVWTYNLSSSSAALG